jgi:hypothetical protein
MRRRKQLILYANYSRYVSANEIARYTGSNRVACHHCPDANQIARHTCSDADARNNANTNCTCGNADT